MVKYLPKGFKVYPLDSYILQLRIHEQRNGGLIRSHEWAFKHNISKYYYATIEARIKDGLNVSIMRYGMPGYGKSTSDLFEAEQILKWIRKYKNPEAEITENHFIFEPSEALQYLNNAKNEVFIVDEQPDRRTGIGSTRFKQDLKNIEKIAMRKRGIHIIWTSPEITDHICMCGVETISKNPEEFQTLHLVYENKIWFYPIGYIITGKPSKELMNIYTKVANKNADQVISQMSSGKKEYWLKLAEKLAENNEFCLAKNQTERMLIASDIIPNIMDMGKEESKMIINQARLILLRKKINMIE